MSKLLEAVLSDAVLCHVQTQDMMATMMVAFSCYFVILGIITMFALSSAGVTKMW